MVLFTTALRKRNQITERKTHPAVRSIYAIYLIFISLFILNSASCKKEVPDINPSEVFEETEQKIKEFYIFQDDGFDIKNTYNAVLIKMNVEKVNDAKSSLLVHLNRLDTAKKRIETYRALRYFLEALPVGNNHFIAPETMLWSRDPERTNGIGLVIKQVAPGKFKTIDTLEGSAAHRENMQTGRFITKVDGVSVSDMDLEELVGRIKGPVDTSVEISYEDKTYKLVRNKVSFQNMLNAKWKLKKNKSAEYIVIRSSLAGTSDQLRALLESLEYTDNVVLDLRKLQPGDFHESFKIADLFLTGGQMGSIIRKDENAEIFTATNKRAFKGNVYVLTGADASPFADVIALALSSSPDVKIIGGSTKGEAFLSKIVKLTSGIELRITTGYIKDANGHPFYKDGLKADFPTKDILPQNPPLQEPDTEDESQVKAAELILKS